MENLSIEYIIIYAFVLINVAAFSLVVYDKRQSVVGTGKDRLPEGVLFFAGTAFGSPGLYLAMLLCRHKTSKWYFQLGIPLLLFQNLAAIIFVINYLA